MPRQSPLEARLSALAGQAARIVAGQEMEQAQATLATLRRPQEMTTAAGLALAQIQAERRAAERALRARDLRALPDLATAELAAAANRTEHR